MQPAPDPSSPLVAKTLRRFVIVFGAVAIVASLVGLLPAKQYLEDDNDCLGRAVAAAFTHDETPCTPRFRVTRTVPAGGWPAIIFFAAAMLPGWFLWKRPRLGAAVGWAAFVAIALVLFVVMTFELELFEHTRLLWTHRVFAVLIAGFTIGLVVGLPIVAGMIAYRARLHRRATEPVFPAARVHREHEH